MKSITVSVKCILLSLLCIAGVVSAVTDQEIQKMQEAMPAQAVVTPSGERTILVFSLSNGFQHGCIPYWAKALDIMGQKTGAFTVVHSTDMGVFTPASLSRFDVICFNNTTKLVPDAAQQKAIMDFITGGKGIVGIHAATDNFDDWPEGAAMMGGVFKGHPWTGGGTWAVKLDEPAHPLMKPFGGQGFKVNDEIYRTVGPEYDRSKQRVLMSLDLSDAATKNADGVGPDDMDTGISWIKPVGQGRLFYGSLGHNNHLTWNQPVLAHYLAGIQYAAGDLKVDDSPVPAGVVQKEAIASLIERLKGYDWADSRAVPIELQKTIRSYYGDKGALAAVEGMLLDALGSDATLAAKDFICRQLAVIGTERSVPVLSGMLADPKTADMARYALEKIPGEAAEDAMMKIARDTDNETILIGIISTLSARRCDCLLELAEAVFSDKPDDEVAAAMVWALGNFADRRSADLLLRVHPKLTGQARQRSYDALLMCADHLSQSGHTDRAGAIYQALYQTDNPSVVRAAALGRLARIGAETISTLLDDAIRGDNVPVRTAAIEALSSIQDERFIQSIAADATDLPEAVQIQLVTALSQGVPAVGRSLAMRLSHSEQPAVRMAAYEALARAGDASAVEVLAEAAATAPNRDERTAAQDALYRMPGKAVDAAILEKITAQKLDEKVLVELIGGAVARQIQEAPAVLFKTAQSDNRRVASESVRAIQSLAGAEQAEAVLDLVIARPAGNTENALLVVAEKVSERDGLVKMILDNYAAPDTNEDAKVSLLRVMGKLGHPDTVGLLKTEYASSNKTLSAAAFGAMTDWPGIDFAEAMKTLARSGADERTRILAFRAYVRMLTEGGKDYEAVRALIPAFALAERLEEQKLLIGALANYGDGRALAFVKKQFDNPALQAEAQTSALQICEKLLTRNPSAAVPVLEALQQSGASESVRGKAGELLHKVGKRDGFVLDWQVSGPYMENGTNGEALFDVVFEPEKSVDAGQWNDALRLLTGDSPPIFDLSGVGRGDNLVAYLKTILSVDQDTPVVLHIGSDDGVKVWVNGELVHANNAGRPVVPGQDTARVTLKKGQNPVLVKIVQRSGNWGFCMNITDSDNRLVSSLDVDGGN